MPHSVAKGEKERERENPSGKETKKRESDRPQQDTPSLGRNGKVGGTGQRLQGALPGLLEKMMKKKKMDIRCSKGG